MSQLINLTLEITPFDQSIQDALTDLGYGIKNDILYSKSFPMESSAFAEYNAAVQAINTAVTSTSYTGSIYLQFSNVEAVWGV